MSARRLSIQQGESRQQWHARAHSLSPRVSGPGAYQVVPGTWPSPQDHRHWHSGGAGTAKGLTSPHAKSPEGAFPYPVETHCALTVRRVLPPLGAALHRHAHAGRLAEAEVSGLLQPGGVDGTRS